MAMAIGAAGRRAMAGLCGDEPPFDSEQSRSRHAGQEESPSQEAHDQ
jgi:hypothetical protein